MDKTYKILIHSILALSIASLTIIFTMAYKNTRNIKIISGIIIFIVFEIVLIKYDWISSFNKQSYIIKIGAVIFSFLSAEPIRSRYAANTISTIQDVLKCTDLSAQTWFYILLVFGIIALFVYYIYLIAYFHRIIYLEVLKKMDQFEKIFFYSFVILMGLISLKLHIHTSAFDFTQYIDINGNVNQIPYDAVMDCDSVAVQWNMRHFDFTLKHPFFAVVTLPVYSISLALGSIFTLSSQWTMAFLSISEILKIAVCGLCIKKMSKSRMALIIYFLSFPVWIYSLVIERHVWMLFWNIIMVYSTIWVKTEQEDYMPIMQAGGANLIGVMITPAVMRVKSYGEFIKKGFILAISFLLIIILTGNLAGLFNISSDLKANTAFVDNTNILSNFARYTHAISGCFGGIRISYLSYYTYYDESGISVIGIAFAIILIISCIVLHKDRYVKCCGYWMSIAVVLFPIVGFSYEDFSMHMILFSWAAISLVAMLYEYLKQIAKNKAALISLDVLIALMIFWEVVTNLKTLNELISYADRFNNLLV